jgi:hypothetical protein
VILSIAFFQPASASFMAFSVASLGPHATRQRSRCLEVGNRLSRNLTALAGFAIAGKIGVRLSGPFILKNRRDVYYAAASIVGHASSNLS